MKISFQHRRAGLSLIDLIVIFLMITAIAALFLISHPRRRASSSANRITCVNNLKQVGLSFRIYAGDNHDKYPMDTSKNGEPLILEATPVYKYFQTLSNELGSTKVVNCPSDAKRKYAENFSNLSDTNIGYFVGLDANENFTNSIFAGDRNIENDTTPDRGLLRLTKNQNVRFTKEIHIKQGDLAMGDGSVQQVSNPRLRSEIIRNSPFATNRIKLP